MSELLDLKDVAVRLGVDYETARKYTASGLLRSVRLPSLKHGGPRRRVQVQEEDLAAFIAKSIVGDAGELATESGPIAVRETTEMAVSNRTRTAGKWRPYEWCK